MGIRKRGIFNGLALAAAGVATALMLSKTPSIEELREKEMADIAYPVIVSSINNETATDADKSARLSDSPEVHAMLRARDHLGNPIYFSEVRSAVVDKKRIQETSTDGLELPLVRWARRKNGKINIEWLEVKAKKWSYDNTVPGQSKIEYEDVYAGSGWEIKPGVGTHRYKIVVNYGGKIFSSKGTMVKKDGSISGPHRITVRESDDIPGWMTAWANTPYIYGSTPFQVENYIGADCADLVSGSMHRMGKKDFPYTGSLGLLQAGREIFRGYIGPKGGLFDLSRRPVNHIDAKRGDLLIYKFPRHHTDVFYSDYTGQGDRLVVVDISSPGGKDISYDPNRPDIYDTSPGIDSMNSVSIIRIW